MKDIWVLSVKTSLPKVCTGLKDWNTTCKVFDSFEKGRDAFRKVVKEFAFSKNSMFDGNGNITHLKNYAAEFDLDEYEDDFEVLDFSRINYVIDSLKKAFTGEDVEFEMESEYCTDWLIAIESKPGEVLFRGEDDGPCNGYNPDIKTNIFSMKDKKDYYLYINDLFGQDDCSSELYIDLINASLQ